MNLYYIVYTKDGVRKTYQIPATSKYNALVRLGQIYGDKETEDEVNIEVLGISLRDEILYKKES